MVVFLGPEGSGKSTQAKLLAEKLKVPYISTGDIIRDVASNNPTELGDACRRALEEHAYLDPQLLLEILMKRLKEDDVRGGFVVDGGFRTLEETQNFGRVVAEADLDDMDVTVVFIRVPGWKAVQRLLKRNREDDTIEGIFSRLGKFYSNLGQRSSLLKKKHQDWKFIIVMGLGSIEGVNKRISQGLDVH